jgi:hypothetical protein
MRERPWLRFYPLSTEQTWFVATKLVCQFVDASLATQYVHKDEQDNHQDGDPKNQLAERADSSRAPVQGKSFGAREAGVAVSASLGLKRADAATLRAGLRIEPLRHKQEIARGGKIFQ